MAGQVVGTVDMSNVGTVCDMQLDYYGKRGACGSRDGNAYVYDIVTDQAQTTLTATLKGHDAPVWKVDWAHPKFGNILATCSYDMKIIVWKEVQQNQWQIAYMDKSHAASVNAVKFGPCDFGLRLAAASSDGFISVLTYSPNDQQWRREALQAHNSGAQAIDWAPRAEQRDPAAVPVMRLVSGGCDNRIAFWRFDGDAWSPENQVMPEGHREWVRDVAWRPTGTTNVVISGGWDRYVIIWAQEVEGTPWRQLARFEMQSKVEQLKWSVTGRMFAACTEHETVLYKEVHDGTYAEVGKVDEQGFTDLAPLTVAPISTIEQGDDGSGMFPMQQQQQQSAQLVPTLTAAQQAEADNFAAQQAAVLDSFGL